ncbi:MAG: flagellar biosynthetic protein FliR [Rhodothermales bacterium]
MTIEAAFLLRVFLVFVRIGGFFMAGPFFGHSSVPVRVRVLLAAVMAFALVGLVPPGVPPHTDQAAGMLAAVLIEAFTGAALGFAARFIFWAVQFGGEVMGFQMGLSMAQAFDPNSGNSANPWGRILSWVFMIFFVLLDGHHSLILALVGSFEIVPLAGAQVAASGPLFLQWTGQFFMTALQIASPFMITFFLVELTLGVFARVAPQTDLFSLSIPLKLFIGLGLAYLFIENLVPTMPLHLGNMVRDLGSLIDVF